MRYPVDPPANGNGRVRRGKYGKDTVRANVPMPKAMRDSFTEIAARRSVSRDSLLAGIATAGHFLYTSAHPALREAIIAASQGRDSDAGHHLSAWLADGNPLHKDRL